MSHLEWTSDLLAMMHVSRTLYQVGVPLLLKDVYIEDYAVFMQFCDYMFKDVSRFRFLKSFTLWPDSFSVRMIDLLVSLLQHAQESLEDLALLQCYSGLKFDERISRAICELKNLKSADFRQIKNPKIFRKTVASMQSKLSKLFVWYPLEEDTFDPIHDFANLASSLEKIFVQNAQFTCDTVVYPRMKEVGMRLCVDAKPAVMAQAYPKLEKLQVDLRRCSYEDPLAADACRERNRRAQDSSRWASLVLLKGCVHSLYVFGLICHVRNLEIDQIVGSYDKRTQEIAHLAAVVSDTKPLRLELRVSGEEQNMDYLMPVFQAARESLTHLIITVQDRQFARSDPQRMLVSSRTILNLVMTWH